MYESEWYFSLIGKEFAEMRLGRNFRDRSRVLEELHEHKEDILGKKRKRQDGSRNSELEWIDSQIRLLESLPVVPHQERSSQQVHALRDWTENLP